MLRKVGEGGISFMTRRQIMAEILTWFIKWGQTIPTGLRHSFPCSTFRWYSLLGILPQGQQGHMASDSVTIFTQAALDLPQEWTSGHLKKWATHEKQSHRKAAAWLLRAELLGFQQPHASPDSESSSLGEGQSLMRIIHTELIRALQDCYGCTCRTLMAVLGWM